MSASNFGNVFTITNLIDYVLQSIYEVEIGGKMAIIEAKVIGMFNRTNTCIYNKR